MKNALCILFALFLILFVPIVSAKEMDVDKILEEQLDVSGAKELSDALPEDIKEILDDFQIGDLIDNNETLSLESVLKNILNLVKLEFSEPIACGFSVLALLLAASMFSSFSDENKTLHYAVTVGITAAAVVPAAKLIISVSSAIKSFGTFMVSFVPIYAGILASSSKPLTAAGYSSLMLLAAEIINLISTFVLIPLSSMQLSFGVCSPISLGVDISQIGSMIKKFSMWLLSVLTTFLLGFLSVQTLISGPKDNLASRTAKFVAGTAIPVVGPTVSEAMNIIKGCLKLLSSSVLIYGVIAVALILLPILLKLIIWRVVLNVCSFSASTLALKTPADLLKSIDSVFAFLIGILILFLLLFLISLTIVSL